MYSYSFEFKLGSDVMSLQYTVGWNAEAFTLRRTHISLVPAKQIDVEHLDDEGDRTVARR